MYKCAGKLFLIMYFTEVISKSFQHAPITLEEIEILYSLFLFVLSLRTLVCVILRAYSYSD